MAALPHKQYTQEECLALETRADYKSELINGQIYAMACASPEHNTITANLVRLIGNRFADRLGSVRALTTSSSWDSPIKVDTRKTLVHNMEEV